MFTRLQIDMDRTADATIARLREIIETGRQIGPENFWGAAPIVEG